MDKEAINNRFIEAVEFLITSKIVQSKGELAAAIGIKPTKFSEILNGRMNIGTDLAANLCAKFNISAYWMLTGYGSMLRDSKNPEESKLGCTPNATPISPSEESIIYKMYKDEKEEKEKLVKEKESKIDHLQSELRAMTEELATLKAKCPEPATSHPEGLGHAKPASTKKPSSPPNADNATSATAQ